MRFIIRRETISDDFFITLFRINSVHDEYADDTPIETEIYGHQVNFRFVARLFYLPRLYGTVIHVF